MVIAIIIIILLLAALCGLFVPYYRVFYSPHKGADEIETPVNNGTKVYHDEVRRQAKALQRMPCQRVITRSFDGLRLCGRYYYRGDNVPLCICFHGYRGSPLRDFSVMGQFLQNEGYNVLLVEQRAHFRSGGHTISYGVRERRDVLSWVEYANRRFGGDTPIYLFGISMGAATVLMSSDLDLPDNVRAICADCPFSSPRDIIRYVAEKTHLNPKLAWPMIWLSGLIYGLLNLDDKVTAAKAVAKTAKPILLIHGEADTFVPAYMSEEIQKANPNLVERHTFPGAGHGVSYFSDPERYIAIVRDFLKRHP